MIEYESWRISFQDSEQAARFAFARWQETDTALKAERQRARELELTVASREAARATYLEEKLAAEAKLARIGALVGKWTADELAQPDAGIGASQRPVRGGITCADELQAVMEACDE